MRRRTLVPLALVALLAAGCSGIPHSSAPRAVRPIDSAGVVAPQPPPQPVDGLQPRELVNQFLDNNGAEQASDLGRQTALNYLTSNAKNKWQDGPTAAVVDQTSTSEPVPGPARSVIVKVTGTQIGSLNVVTGIYTPSPTSTTVVRQFVVARQADGQYRIAQLSNGLLLTAEQFAGNFHSVVLYFFDPTQHSLVPDPRWIAQVDPTAIIRWLIGQLVTGPSDELGNAVTSETFPAGVTSANVEVSYGDPVRMDIPGARGLDAAGRSRLAQQLTRTLFSDNLLSEPGERSRHYEITDGGVPVSVPGAVGSPPTFTLSTFNTNITAGPPLRVYYVRNGRVVDASGTAVPGAAGDGRYFISSVAVGQPSPPNGPFYLAGVIGTGARSSLVIGPLGGALTTAKVPRGRLTRPAFVPGRGEVWVASGARLWAVGLTGKVTSVTLPPQISGTVQAVRLSPDGYRVALVIGPPGQGRLYVGAVARTDTQITVDGLTSIGRPGTTVTDVAWIDGTQLYAIGTPSATGDLQILRIHVDGSPEYPETAGSIDLVGLPGVPAAITVASGASVWVSVGTPGRTNTVWRRAGTAWVPPTAGVTHVSGVNPAYLE